MVNAETAQRFVNRGFQVFWLSVDHSVTEDVANLGAQEYLIALSAILEPGRYILVCYMRCSYLSAEEWQGTIVQKSLRIRHKHQQYPRCELHVRILDLGTIYMRSALEDLLVKVVSLLPSYCPYQRLEKYTQSLQGS